MPEKPANIILSGQKVMIINGSAISITQRHNMKKTQNSIVCVALALMFAIGTGCVSSRLHVSRSYTTGYDVTYDAALAAARDIGVNIINASRDSGTIFGQKGITDVSIGVSKTPTGTDVSVKLTSISPIPPSFQKIKNEFLDAFQRRQPNK